MNPFPLLKPLAVLALTVCAVAAARAAPNQPLAGAETRLAQVMADPKAREAAIQAGRRAADFCANCHGETGVSSTDTIPNLAGQDALYLLNQIDKFGDGRRKDEFMSGLVKLLKPNERLNIAVFYASQPVRAAPAQAAGALESGRKYYQRACVGCHGQKAHGTREIARLAGQQRRYLINSLAGYRAGKGARTDPRMTGVARQLGDADIAALAAYLASLP